jgi:hypothetical protein
MARNKSWRTECADRAIYYVIGEAQDGSTQSICQTGDISSTYFVVIIVIDTVSEAVGGAKDEIKQEADNEDCQHKASHFSGHRSR